MVHFLLVYDLQAQKLGSHQEYSDPAQAAATYAEMELRYRADRGLEIVLVGADSMKTIMTTHSQYFGDSNAPEDISRYLVSADVG
jgi:hypothetical protein